MGRSNAVRPYAVGRKDDAVGANVRLGEADRQKCLSHILLLGGVGFGCGVGVFLLEALDSAGSVH